MKTNDAFDRGFLKAAVINKVNPVVALGMLKKASENSSWLGRWLAMKGGLGAAAAEHPVGANLGAGIGAFPGGFAGGFANAVAPGAGLPFLIAGAPLQGLGANLGAAGFSSEKREETMNKARKNYEGRSNLENMWDAAKRYGKWSIPIGALVGAGIGGITSYYNNHKLDSDVSFTKKMLKGPPTGEGPAQQYDTDYYTRYLSQALQRQKDFHQSVLGNSAAGAGIGAAAGTGLAGLQGLFGGGIPSVIIKNTSDETKDRAIKMKAKHPFLTSLPFGDMIGAANA